MNFQAYNDKIYTLPLKCKDALGANQPWPPSPGILVTSSNPTSLVAAVGGQIGAPALVLIPKVQASPGIIVSVTGINMAPASFVVDVVADPNLLSIVIDTAPADVVSAVQSVPAAPGP